ncbi:MAG: hypothetical protein RMX63_08460 [Aulosira sp. ZfuCHP01]|nr:hypothetical protein [Aulosira sp. ZfuVER01]MDZ8002049.1 hypothetical protein [Aulosira sp. DedVER01a]MDZ8051484.1 hypothetical protein [Aulosira sp. ZfuCHP01]
MNRNLLLQELAIAITGKNLNPTVLNPDFLKYTGVILSNWQLEPSSVSANEIAQIIFSNRLSNMTQPLKH